MDEVFIRLQGVQHYLWRAVDQDGVVLLCSTSWFRNAAMPKPLSVSSGAC
jgi:putative transposase